MLATRNEYQCMYPSLKIGGIFGYHFKMRRETIYLNLNLTI